MKMTMTMRCCSAVGPVINEGGRPQHHHEAVDDENEDEDEVLVVASPIDDEGDENETPTHIWEGRIP
jgi:hypothetical protein